MPIRILIADDHGIIRSGIRNELATHPDIEVMGDAGDGDEALKMTLELRPDILLLDINMPGLKAHQVLYRLERAKLTTRVIVFTASDDPLTIKEMLKAGVKGYVLKGDDPEDLIRVIHVVMNGKTWLSPTVTGEVVEAFVEDKIEDDSPLLSDREIKILHLLSKGYRSEQIGKELFIAKRTVNYYIERIYKRLQVNNRAEAITKAIQHGLIQF